MPNIPNERLFSCNQVFSIARRSFITKILARPTIFDYPTTVNLDWFPLRKGKEWDIWSEHLIKARWTSYIVHTCWFSSPWRGYPMTVIQLVCMVKWEGKFTNWTCYLPRRGRWRSRLGDWWWCSDSSIGFLLTCLSKLDCWKPLLSLLIMTLLYTRTNCTCHLIRLPPSDLSWSPPISFHEQNSPRLVTDKTTDWQRPSRYIILVRQHGRNRIAGVGARSMWA